MAESQVVEISKRKQVRQPPAVPFLWEVKPGIAKRDWKPEVSSLSSSPVVTHPIKLIASIPFDWEEKPGMPLPRFAEPVVLPTPPEMLYNLPPPPGCYHGYDGVDSDNNEDSDDDHDEQRGSFDLELEAFDFDTDDSFSSAPSLLANCLIPSEAISSAIPVQKSSSSHDASNELKIPSSPASETDSSTSSCATGTSSPVGASFLERLFPLLPPKSSFLEREGRYERGSLTPQVKSKDIDRESNSSVVIRRPPTLGELIMMSRRRSYQRKALPEHKYNRNLKRGLLGALELASK